MLRRTLALVTVACLVTLFSALGSTPRAEAGACATPDAPLVGVMPTSTDIIPRGEGILVSIVGSTERSLGEANRAGASLFEVGARLERDGHEPIALRVVELGPALARLVPERSPAPGAWRAVSRGSSVEVSFGATPAAAIASAPSLRSVSTRTTSSQGPGGGGSYRSTLAELSAPIGTPAWQGLIVYQAHSRTAEGAIAARPLNGTSTTQLVYADPGRCGFFTPNQSAPPVGSLVRIAVYDLWGRVSARTNQVRVQ